ncbi:DUF2336 domain-containing protein [uncultured Rhodoblastus sp.]|uniref:DUF2336 domain-containing protein n=1 Tax=uncultured Rhodoblastus sp. TaxID=543037 RepID=UPI0025DB9A43|nr:DUF2336 domain-containing protein [uncultured Rhodoblastus sp.]
MQTDIFARLRDLAASAGSGTGEMRPILLRVATDLFALHERHRPHEIRLYEEMADRLIADADEASLTLVARKLARCPDAPAAILRRIRARGGAPEVEILAADPRIEHKELRQVAAGGACDHACAVAGRDDLDREIAKILSRRPEREVVRALAANAKAPLAVEELRLLCARGRDDAVLAQALLARGEPMLEWLPLYLAADAAQREKLIGLARAAGLAQIGRPDDLPPLDEEAAARLESCALRRKRSALALTLAEILGCDQFRARKIVGDEGGDALTLAFIAIGLPREAAARILLAAFPKVALSVGAFARTMALYARLPRREASRIVAAFAGEAGKAGAKFLRARAARAQAGRSKAERPQEARAPAGKGLAGAAGGAFSARNANPLRTFTRR